MLQTRTLLIATIVALCMATPASPQALSPPTREPLAQTPPDTAPLTDPTQKTSQIDAAVTDAEKAQADVATARTALVKATGPGTILQDGIVFKFKPQNGAPRDLTAEETGLASSFFMAQAVQRAAIDRMRALFATSEEQAELKDARAAAYAALAAGATPDAAKPPGDASAAGAAPVSPANNALSAAFQRITSVDERINARIKEFLIMRAPMRIVADPALEGRTGQTRPGGDTILRQPVVFNRAATLATPMTVRLRKAESTLPAGTKLYGVTGNSWCLPPPTASLPGWITTGLAWRPCYMDADGDGKLDTQTVGGKAIGGVYVSASGVGTRGEVVTPAALSTLPPLDGFRQFFGVRAYAPRFDRKNNRRLITLGAWMSPDDKAYGMPINGLEASGVVGADGKAMVEFMGARIEIQEQNGGWLYYRIVAPLPEQPLSVDVQTSTTTTFIPIYVPR